MLRYALTVRVLRRADQLPRRLGQFLDWAYTAGLVRLTGTATQFRHQDLQTHLTNHTTRRYSIPSLPDSENSTEKLSRDDR